MAELTTQISIVPLARDRMRLFAAPIIFVLLATAAVAGGLLIGGPAGIGLVALAGLSALVAAYLAALVSSYRLVVEPGALKLQWLGGERRYRLVRGSVTRVVVRGRGAAALHPRFGALGWAVGPAMLRGETPIELIRLSVRPALIVVPTDRGRLAVAAAAEGELLAALTSAVRLQERLDQIAYRRSMPSAALALPGPPQPAAPSPIEPPPPAAPRVLTGIERTLIEQRLAVERAAAQAAAEAARAAAGGAMPEPIPASPMVAAAPLAAEVRAVAPAAVPVERRQEPARPQRPASRAARRPITLASFLPIILPLIATGIVWVAITATGRPTLPAADTRLLLVGLALIGPMGAIGGLIARAWYPRLGGLVVASAFAALAMLTRTILA